MGFYSNLAQELKFQIHRQYVTVQCPWWSECVIELYLFENVAYQAMCVNSAVFCNTFTYFCVKMWLQSIKKIRLLFTDNIFQAYYLVLVIKVGHLDLYLHHTIKTVFLPPPYIRQYVLTPMMLKQFETFMLFKKIYILLIGHNIYQLKTFQ